MIFVNGTDSVCIAGYQSSWKLEPLTKGDMDDTASMVIVSYRYLFLYLFRFIDPPVTSSVC